MIVHLLTEIFGGLYQVVLKKSAEGVEAVGQQALNANMQLFLASMGARETCLYPCFLLGRA